MPSPFQQHKQRLNKKALKEGSLLKHLRDLKQDMRKAKKGEPTEEPIEVIRESRRRIKAAIREEGRKEKEAYDQERDESDPTFEEANPRPKGWPSDKFKLKPATGIAGARG